MCVKKIRGAQQKSGLKPPLSGVDSLILANFLLVEMFMARLLRVLLLRVLLLRFSLLRFSLLIFSLLIFSLHKDLPVKVAGRLLPNLFKKPSEKVPSKYYFS